MPLKESSRKVLLLLVLFGAQLISSANISLPKIFTSNMILQRDKPVSIWGWASKGESVVVYFNGQTVKTRANKKGEWMLRLSPMPANMTPGEMRIEGKNKILLRNILLGDVYICSGQSNMEWTLNSVNNADYEISQANYPGIRSFNVPKATSYHPEKDFTGGEWMECNPQNAGSFSAVAYFFARKLIKDLGVPIGLLHTSWGGTNVQAWISWDIMGKNPAYQSVDFTQMEKDKEGVEERLNQFRESIKNDKGIAEKWFDPVTPTADWKPIEQPKMWEETAIGNVDGVIWLRREVELTKEFTEGTAELSLGPIDDNDITYVNGVEVGATNAYNQPRLYSIKPGILKPGKNSIIIKVTDTGGGGGVYGDAGQLYIQSAGKKISLAGPWVYKASALSSAFNLHNAGPNEFPSQLYNAMIAPVINLGIKGAIWYQGESNAGESYKYRTLFPEMIRDWRSKWKEEFPFFWVQLANFMKADSLPVESGWAELREAQSMTLALPKTGQAVIIDIGEAGDIHPRNKQDVGYRLALSAEKVVYDKDIVYAGPVYQSMKKEGNKIILQFGQTGSGMIARDRYGYLKGFAIAGADKKFTWAKAMIDGDRIIVFSDAVTDPVAVRYAWANNPEDANLYNKEGLPASPFRTDDWPGITAGKNDYR